MALSSIFYARGDSNSAQNAAINVRNTGQVPVTSIQFTSGAGGDLILDYVPDGADANTIPEFDPDTQVIINGVARNFAFVKSGNLDPARTDPPLENALVYVIKVDMNGDGDMNDAGDTQFFFTTLPSVTPAIMANNIQNGACPLSNLDISPPPSPVCFCSGTDIATPNGLRRVETLRSGDSVLTEDGRTAQIAWVGLSTYSTKALARDPSLRPVRIPANAFGHGLPVLDLDVSPQHRIVVDGAECELLFGTPRSFVIARHLLGTIAHTPEIEGSVTYVHLLLDTHEIVVSNGLPSESFQPARRMLELMTGESRDRLNAALEVLGAEAMLTRPDALQTLSSREARVFLEAVKPADMAPTPGSSLSAGHHLH